MNNKFTRTFLNSAARILLGFVLAFGTTTFAHAQGEIASGTISGSGSGTFVYNLTFSDASGASAPIGSVWYAWIPGVFYLPGVPTGASAPSGWTASIAVNSVQFVANSAANDIAPGQSLSGFSYQATFSPAQLASAFDSGVSFAYSGGLLLDAGEQFTVQTVPVPEPSGQMLLLLGATAFWRIRRRILPNRPVRRG